MARFRSSWEAVGLAPLKVFWRPQLLTALLFEGAMFGFQIGFHVWGSLLHLLHQLTVRRRRAAL